MREHLKDFWRRLQTGIEVAVAGSGPELLLGVRDGFREYFGQIVEAGGLSAAIVPQDVEARPAGLLGTDEEIAAKARAHCLDLRSRLGEDYQFFLSNQAGVVALDLAGEPRYFVRSWTYLIGPAGESLGASGSVQLPAKIVGGLSTEDACFFVPGTRRKGGLLRSITGGLDTRRRAVAASTRAALATQFHGLLGGEPEVL